MNLTNEDFMHLHNTSMEWGEHWKEQAERFEPTVTDFEWRWAYWFDSYPSLLLARQALEQQDIPSRSFWDMASRESYEARKLIIPEHMPEWLKSI